MYISSDSIKWNKIGAVPRGTNTLLWPINPDVATTTGTFRVIALADDVNPFANAADTVTVLP